jgi:CheY-like chemotaxis protein
MRKLLLADDSVTIQRVIELTFSGEDIEVVAVNDGEQAIARIPAEHPDIVLADIGMPKKGGYDVAAFVKGRADLEHIPVLLLAGAFEPVDQARAEQVRCDGVLIKPFEPRQVIERVRELLDGMKGSSAQATGDVVRPVERLSPRPEPLLASMAAVAARPASPPGIAPPSVPQTDLALDDYFDSLNSAFESVGQAGTPSIAEIAEIAEPPIFEVMRPAPVDSPDRSDGAATPHPLRRRGDALDDCFDRLSTAFEQAKERARRTRSTRGSTNWWTRGGCRRSTRSSAVRTAAPTMNGHHEARPQPDRRGARGHARRARRRPGGAGAAHAAWHARRAGAAHRQRALRSDLADAVTERVLERLVPEITATVQRLVQEEVDRIRRHH